MEGEQPKTCSARVSKRMAPKLQFQDVVHDKAAECVCHNSGSGADRRTEDGAVQCPSLVA